MGISGVPAAKWQASGSADLHNGENTKTKITVDYTVRPNFQHKKKSVQLRFKEWMG